MLAPLRGVPAGSERASQILPSVNCSTCHSPIPLSDLGSHVCSGPRAGVPTPPSLSSLRPTPAGGHMHTPARLSISSLRQMRPSTEQDRGGGGGGSGGAFGPPLARTNVFQGAGGDGGRPGSHASTHSMSSGMSGGAGSRLFSPQQRQLSPSPTSQRPGPPTHSVSYSAVSSSFLEGAAGATSPRPVPQRSKTAGPPDLTTSVYSPTVSHSAPSSNSTHLVRPSFSASLNNPPHPQGAGGGGQGDWAGLASGNGPPLPALSLKREPQSPMLLVSPDNVVRTEAGGESGMAGVGRRAFAKATAQVAQAQTLMSAGSEYNPSSPSGLRPSHSPSSASTSSPLSPFGRALHAAAHSPQHSVSGSSATTHSRTGSIQASQHQHQHQHQHQMHRPRQESASSLMSSSSQARPAGFSRGSAHARGQGSASSSHSALSGRSSGSVQNKVPLINKYAQLQKSEPELPKRTAAVDVDDDEDEKSSLPWARDETDDEAYEVQPASKSPRLHLHIAGSGAELRSSTSDASSSYRRSSRAGGDAHRPEGSGHSSASAFSQRSSVVDQTTTAQSSRVVSGFRIEQEDDDDDNDDDERQTRGGLLETTPLRTTSDGQHSIHKHRTPGGSQGSSLSSLPSLSTSQKRLPQPTALLEGGLEELLEELNFPNSDDDEVGATFGQHRRAGSATSSAEILSVVFDPLRGGGGTVVLAGASASSTAPVASKEAKVCLRCGTAVGGTSGKKYVRLAEEGVVGSRNLLCEDDWKEMYLPKCRRCALPIESQAISSADGQLKGKYHRACFTCYGCNEPFNGDTFYVHNDRPHCEWCYHRANNSLCASPSCGKPIEGPCAVLPSATDGPAGREDRFHPFCLRCDHPQGCANSMHEHYDVPGAGRFCPAHVNAALETAGAALAGDRTSKGTPEEEGKVDRDSMRRTLVIELRSSARISRGAE